jgi:hypothetical protein
MTECKPSPPENPLPRLAVRIDDAVIMTGVNRSRLYEAVRGKNLTARKVGRATILLVGELENWLKSLPAIGKVPDIGSPTAGTRA